MRPAKHKKHTYNSRFFYISKETVFYTLSAIIGLPLIWFGGRLLSINVPIWGLIIFMILLNPQKAIFKRALQINAWAMTNAFVICFFCVFFLGTNFTSLLVASAAFFVSCSLISNKIAPYRSGIFTVVVIMASSSLGVYKATELKAVLSISFLLIQVIFGFIVASSLNHIYYFIIAKRIKK